MVLFASFCASAKDEKNYADYANLLIGTDMFHAPKYNGNNSLDPDFGLYANEIVGPRMPNGPVSPSPLTSFQGITYHARGSGYCHSDKYIMGFSQINTEYNSFCCPIVMPIVGKLYTDSGDTGNVKGYRAKKDSESEIAKPYYYTVKLKDSGVKVEITCSENVGVYRFTFPKSRSSKILIDAGTTHRFSYVKDADIKIVNNDTIEGFQDLFIRPNFRFYGTKLYFVAKFDREILNNGTWFGEKIYSQDSARRLNAKYTPKTKIGAFMDFMTEENEQVNMKIAISFESIEDAYKKLQEQTPDWNFDATKQKAKDAWNAYLSRIEVEGGTQAQKTLFYTSMVRSANFSSVETIAMLSTMNYQVLFLTSPDKVVEKIDGIVKSGYVRRGFFGNGMISNSLAFYRRGAKIDLASIFNTYYKLLTDPKYERYAEYMKLGYLPFVERNTGVYKMNEDCANRTLGYAYEYYCLAEMAKILGDNEKADFLMKYSHGWKNVFDPVTKFVRGKTADGKWLEPFDPNVATLRSPYNEGNAWHYSFMVFHDIPELTKLMGGRKAFIAKLDEMFKAPYKSVFRDVSGMIGAYTHGNGNDRYIPYLYTELGCPWKTQKMVRFILDTLYKPIAGGLTNNDDYANMSGWYVMSAMGMYPPINIAASDNFVLAAPIFKKITIRLPELIYGGNTFTIECENYDEKNIYATSVELDGKPLENFKLPMDALKKNKRLVFKMSSIPKKE